MLKIVADIDIPFLNGVFEPFASVEYFKGDDIKAENIKKADILIIRTRTKCNESLLKGSSVKLIATATIGTDHIDSDYCRDNNIEVVNAPGCNSGGVLQYFYTAIFKYAATKGVQFSYKRKSGHEEANPTKIGIIGVGNVGGKIAALGEYLGFEILRNDPPKEREQTLSFNKGFLRLDEFKTYYSLDYLLRNSDIVTMHVPLQEETIGMASEEFFAKMKQGAVFMNASRGEVVDEAALLRYLDSFSAVICDVWNHEPAINRELLKRAFIATPHIAGYSFEGKVNGTQMSIRSVAKYVCDNDHLKEILLCQSGGGSNKQDILCEFEKLKVYEVPVAEKNNNIFDFDSLSEEQVAAKLLSLFPLMETSESLKASPEEFEKLRNNYNYRREFYVKGV